MPYSRAHAGAGGRAGTRTQVSPLQLQDRPALLPIKCMSEWLNDFITPAYIYGVLILC